MPPIDWLIWLRRRQRQVWISSKSESATFPRVICLRSHDGASKLHEGRRRRSWSTIASTWQWQPALTAYIFEEIP